MSPPPNCTTTWACNTNNLVTSITAPPQSTGGQSPVTSRTYDADGRLSTVTIPMSQTTTLGYDSDGHTTSVEDNLGGTKRCQVRNVSGTVINVEWPTS